MNACSATRRKMLATGLGMGASALMSACTTGLGASAPVAEGSDAAVKGGPDLAALVRARSLSYLLLGEIHDSAVQHRMRLSWLQQLAARADQATPLRLTLAFEQLDAVRQPELDGFQATLSAVARQAPDTARALAKAAGFNFEGWHWPFYEPAFQLALRQSWRIAGVNLPAAEAMKIARNPSPAPLPAAMGWTAQDEQAMRAEIQSGHCDALPPQAVPPMARAQMARDECMAQALKAALRKGSSQPGRPVVILLAGNGHVRRDLGVPRHLKALDPASEIYSVGLLEREGFHESLSRAYDRTIFTAAQSREDPCIAFKRRMSRPAKP